MMDEPDTTAETAGTRVPAVIPAEDAPSPGAPAITASQRDFLLLIIYVYLQHNLYDRAEALVEGMIAAGDDGREIVIAEAVLAFCQKDYERTLEILGRLDRIDPIERYAKKTLTERQRMRSYLRARSIYELGGRERTAIDLYIRHQEFDGKGED